MAYFIGVMSGTSLDGVDIVIADFDSESACQVIHAETVPYPADLRQHLLQLVEHPHCALMTLGNLDSELGTFIGQSITSVLAQCQLSASDIEAIGSHGHTVFHAPDSASAFSLQIGNAHVIAEITGITTIADFRQRDLAVGGQGAPLVPAFHQAMFSSASAARAIVNIGGIANVTLLDPIQPVLGFDTGPGNTLMDNWIYQHLGQAFDANGNWAKQGQCNEDLLASLQSDPYFQRDVPKSTGREYFHLNWLSSHLEALPEPLLAVDVQATLLALTASTIAQAIEQYSPTVDQVLVCGGGARNPVLMQALQDQFNQITVDSTASAGLDPDWVEGCAFAWLAQRHLAQLPGNLPSVTGASRPVVLGACYPA